MRWFNQRLAEGHRARYEGKVLRPSLSFAPRMDLSLRDGRSCEFHLAASEVVPSCGIGLVCNPVDSREALWVVPPRPTSSVAAQDLAGVGMRRRSIDREDVTGHRTFLQLKAAVEHIGYELDMCMAAFAMQANLGGAPSHELNVVLEAQIVHARALIEFLLRDGRTSDMRRDQFAAGWTPSPEDAVTRLEAIWEPANRRVGHLSWVRVDEPRVSWLVVRIAQDVLAVAKSWNDYVGLTSPELSAEFDPHVDGAETTMNYAIALFVLRDAGVQLFPWQGLGGDVDDDVVAMAFAPEPGIAGQATIRPGLPIGLALAAAEDLVVRFADEARGDQDTFVSWDPVNGRRVAIIHNHGQFPI